MAALRSFNFVCFALALAAPGKAVAAPAATLCPSILQPVCARGEGSSRTFANRCLAEGAGYSVLGEGSCEGAAGRRVSICTKEYLPVCADRGGVRRTFGNACEARAEGFAIIAQGPC